MFALVDCNNFYASCEKLFRPDLKHTPVVVLSNNDGCVVARSKEAKALGFKMGEPYFQVKEKIDRHGVEVFSSNYALYADISRRVMETLESITPAIEIYSIDEAFIDLTGMQANFDLLAFGQMIRNTVLKHTAISVGVGIAKTKTLAKLANNAAKTYPKTGGVVVLTEQHRIDKLMSITPVGEVWGVGRRISQQLEAMRINTIADFLKHDTGSIRKRFSVVLERTQRELKGTPCFALDETPTTKQQIVCSRSFGERIIQFEHLAQAVSGYIVRACEKLRAEGVSAKQISVFCRTSPFADREPYYSNHLSTSLDYPSDDTAVFLHLGNDLLKRIYKDGYRYAKAGVMLSDFYAPGTFQLGLFDPTPTDNPQRKQLLAALDAINQQHKGAVFYAAQGVERPWAMKRDKVSPQYTTKWRDLPVVR
jgi:DNA polymerase V